MPFDWYDELKQVADALKIPMALGEQEANTHNFRWVLANNAVGIVQQDMFYFGGMASRTNGGGSRQDMHPAHLVNRTRLPLHDAFRFGDPQLRALPRIQGVQ